MQPDRINDGLLVIDKPGGLTSRAVVDRVQHWFPATTRIGHTGTLDPLATGVLVLCVGSATRLVEYFQRMKKTYQTCLTLGSRSDTDDADGAVMAVKGASPPARSDILTGLERFVGEIEQVPPAYSAANIQGRRAYALARKGRQVDLAPRVIQIHAIDVIAYDYPHLELEVCCGKGTYVRSLARDLGEFLGCGALVQTLRRTHVGPFVAENGLRLDLDPATAAEHLLPLSAALADLPQMQFSVEESRRLRHGQQVTRDFQGDGNEAMALDDTGALIGVVRREVENTIVALKILSR
jgi:tRNA pseudouridine55 synthase